MLEALMNQEMISIQLGIASALSITAARKAA